MVRAAPEPGRGCRKPALRARRRYLQVIEPALPLQLAEQHWDDAVQEVPAGRQGWHDGAVEHWAVSLQSTSVSQSLSTPSVHELSMAGGAPQSPAQLHLVSVPLHARSPQTGAAPQSREQLVPFSPLPQAPSPQQPDEAVVVQLPHCEALQPTLFTPPAAPQQKREAGLPPC
jgi:hypothetical protein